MSPSAKSRRSASGWRGLSASVLGALMLFGAGARSSDAFGQDPGGAELGASGGQPSLDLAPPRPSTGSDVQLAPEELLDRAKAFVLRIEQSSGSISRQLQAARKERDVVRVLCLNDKLNQVDVALGSARDRLGSLRTAESRVDVDRSRHEFAVLEVLNERVLALLNESNECVGEETGFVGEAEVTVSVDRHLPNAATTFDYTSNSPPPPPDISSPIE